MQAIINQLKALMKEHDLSQIQVARAVGVSTATINQFIKGTYPGDNKKIANQVQQFMARYTERKEVQTGVFNFVITKTVKKMLEVIHIAHIENEINVICGKAGLGKTEALKHYKTQNKNAILIETDPGYSAKAILELLCEALNIQQEKTTHSAVNACIRELKGSDKVLLIDEAENLPLKSLELIRRIHDKAGVGVILSGTHRLIVNLKGKKGEYAQLYSRVGMLLQIGNMLPDDDINSIIENAGYQDDVAEALFTASLGSCRRLGKLFKLLKRMARLNNGVASAAMVQQCAKQLVNN
jgi:DNA transposition AAA+ family ATPase